MKTLFVALALVLVVAPLTGQQQKVRDRSKDNFEELESGRLTLRFFDAISGKPISAAEVSIDSIGDFTTDEEGKILFAPPAEDGSYGVSFRSEGYVPTDFPIEIETGSLYFNRYSISPILDVRFLRVVLDWGKSPRDLDLHLLKEGGYHISYRDMTAAQDGAAELDRDDLDGYGPETITVKEVTRGARYRCFVHDYTHRDEGDAHELTSSHATVKVYGQGKLLKLFEVPRTGRGTVWNVFTLEGGVITGTGSLQPN
jgi:hypothetical protein